MADYPDVDIWLAALDSDPVWGKKQLNFAQYAPSLLGQGLLDISDIVGLSVEKLAELGSMPYGIANQCLPYP